MKENFQHSRKPSTGGPLGSFGISEDNRTREHLGNQGGEHPTVAPKCNCQQRSGPDTGICYQ